MTETFMQALIQFKIVIKDGKPDIQIIKKFITETGAPKKRAKVAPKMMMSEEVQEVEM
jgi:hypothetical protein